LGETNPVTQLPVEPRAGRRPFRRRSYRPIFIVAMLVIFALLRWWRGDEQFVPPPSPLPPSSSPRSSSPQVSPRAPADAGTYRVVRVVDGDTILIPPHEFVRLIGVNSPESVRPEHPVEPWGPEASDFTRKFVAGGSVQLTFDRERKDRFGRMLAYVWVDGKLLNEELLRAGLARWERNFHYASEMKSRFRAAEQEAKQAQRGIWSREPSPSGANLLERGFDILDGVPSPWLIAERCDASTVCWTPVADELPRHALVR